MSCRHRNNRTGQDGVRVAMVDCSVLAVASLVTYALVTHVLSRIYFLSPADDLIGGLWAVLATIFLPFEEWALAVLIGASALAVTLLGRPGDVITAAITTAVVMVASAVSPQHAWQQPVLRFADTVIGVAVGVAAAWVGLRLTGPMRQRQAIKDR